MTTRTERDRAKAQQEKFQAVLSGLLKDEDNKYCEDCDAKAPRWASWNLGVFLCIRCAGIHRNLGVHISRVKSVNLDSWTAEQVAMMQEMGNSRARAVYEANVQDSFRRPQTDSALEAFIRAKYEQKKYIAKEWVPPKPVIPKEWLEDDKAEKKKIRSKPTSNITLTNPSSSSSGQSEARAAARPAASSAPAEPKPSQPPAPKPKASSDDLLGLDFSSNDLTKSEVPQTGGGGGGQGGDLLADIFGGSQVSAPAQGGAVGQQNLMSAQQNGSAEPNLFESSNGEGQGEKKSAKDSIMALYGSGGNQQQQMFGVPGTDMIPNGDMMPPNSGIIAASFATVASNNPGVPAFNACQGASSSGMMTSNAGIVNPFSGMDSGAGFSGMMTSNTGMMAPNPGMFSEMTNSNTASAVAASSSFKSQAPGMFSGNAGMNATPSMTSKSGIFSTSSSIISQQLKSPLAASDPMRMAQTMGLKTASAGISSNTKSVSSHTGVMPSAKPQGVGTMSPTMASNPFVYPGAEFYQSYTPNMYYYPAAGGMYMPQQQMYGNAGMQPMVQPQQPPMMGMQQGMMGQPVQQGMMGMPQQQPGAMFGNAGQMGQNPMGGNMMGGGQGGMMGRPAGQMYIQQQQQPQPQQQHMNPMQQQMQFQQMQQQMANMSMGAGSQMGSMQTPPQAAVGGGSWGAGGTGQTLSNNLWQ